MAGDAADGLAPWARHARTVFRASLLPWVLLYLASVAIDQFDVGPVDQPLVTAAVVLFVAITVTAGLAWLVGEVVAGFRGD